MVGKEYYNLNIINNNNYYNIQHNIMKFHKVIEKFKLNLANQCKL
jgi:hypothetical protein